MKLNKLAALLIVFISASSYADVDKKEHLVNEKVTGVVETWKCWDTRTYVHIMGSSVTDRQPPAGVGLTANLAENSGTVNFGGVTEVAEFELFGLERKWDWCMDEHQDYKCAFAISVDGTGAYYNFRGSESGKSVMPSEMLKCSKQ